MMSWKGLNSNYNISFYYHLSEKINLQEDDEYFKGENKDFKFKFNSTFFYIENSLW